MAFDVKKWLVDEMGFSVEDAETMAPKFTAERTTKLESSFKSAAEIEAQRGEIVKTQNALKEANERLNAEMAEWATLTAREKDQNTAQAAALEAARVRATQLETRLTQLATEHGVDPKPLIEGTVTIPPKKEEPAVPPVDPSKFVGVDQFGTVTDFMLTLPASLQYIEREHFALTGEHLDTREIVKEVKARAGTKGADVDPVHIWESKYEIGAKREAKAQKDQEAREAAAEARGYERARTEQALPGNPVPGRHAPVFGSRGADGNIAPRTSVLKRPQPESTVRRAAAALAAHKYRQAG